MNDLITNLLQSDQRRILLALLVGELCLAARVNYPQPDGPDAASAVRELCALNEALHAVANQLRTDAYASESSGYPDEVFAESTLGMARMYAADQFVRTALLRSAERSSR
jgi:outer membrane murein-binding lipoprotein Lpp